MNRLFDKGRAAASDARLLFENGRYDGACNRAYYAMFNTARGLLEARGHDPETVKRHASVLRRFSFEFVMNGPFDDEDGRALRRSGAARRTADYAEMDVTEAEARTVMESLERFMRTAVALIDSTGSETPP